MIALGALADLTQQTGEPVQGRHGDAPRAAEPDPR